jgi:hypothetical protein
MKPSPLRRLLGGLVCLAWGLHAVCGHADTIAEDAFNYPPLGSAIDGETGGAGAPGWASAWAADATLTAGGG